VNCTVAKINEVQDCLEMGKRGRTVSKLSIFLFMVEGFKLSIHAWMAAFFFLQFDKHIRMAFAVVFPSSKKRTAKMNGIQNVSE
jgi:hypothetical protein